MLKAPLKYADDGTTLDEVKEKLISREAMLWVYGDIDMAVVLSRENGYLYAWLISGKDHDSWLGSLINAMMRYAVENDMKGLKAVTRPGMAKLLRARGWRTEAEIVRL